MAQKRYLVTGAAGFIGSAIGKRLLDHGHEVWTIDNLSTGRKENIPPGMIFLEGDCQNPQVIGQLSGMRFDAIIHFAGQSSGEISFDDPVYDLRTNTEATLRLIDYALRNDCPRFIYASSMSVYGAVEDKAISEDHPLKPLSFYGVGKLASEHYMTIYASKGLIPTSLRLFNVYGPNQNMNNLRQGMVSIFLAQLLSNDTIVVKGMLERFRDFIYIDDCVDFITRIIHDKRSYRGIYNVGTSVRTTVRELLDMMMSIGRISKKVVIDKGTPGDQAGIYADVSLARKELDFRCLHGLEQGLGIMIEWAKSLVK